MALDVAELTLPAAVRVADGVPHPAVVGDAAELQLPVHPGAADRYEAPGVSGLALDVAELTLPAAVRVADGVPHPTDARDPAELQLTEIIAGRSHDR